MFTTYIVWYVIMGICKVLSPSMLFPVLFAIFPFLEDGLVGVVWGELDALQACVGLQLPIPIQQVYSLYL